MQMNYQKKMEAIISGFEKTGLVGDQAPALLLHSCCAPCSSSVITALSAFFNITVFYYNPNIDEKDEYEKRAREQERFISLIQTPNPVRFLEGDYRPQDFLTVASPFSHEKEGGNRCSLCYSLRLEKTAKLAHDRKSDFFTTTLTVSPLKDAERINSIGSALAEKYNTPWLWSDFKKKDGYKKSVELSKTHGLYRQDYCGCSFSRRERDRVFT